jgi:RNA polymerase sporulation-specific sigma factor
VALLEHKAVTETMSDEELVLLAREGCENAFTLLIQRCAPMIKWQAASFKNSQLETDDLAQEGFLGLLSAVRTYNKSSASFRTYASVCVRNRILTVVKRSGAASQIPLSEIVSIDEQKNSSSSGCMDDPAQLVVQKEDVFRLKDWLQELLSSKEYQVLMLYLRAYAYQDIAKQLGMSVKSVDNSLQRVRRKLVTVSFPGS